MGGESGGWEKMKVWREGEKKKGAESSVCLSSCVQTGSAVWLHCSISLPWPSQKHILRSLPPFLPLPPVISPPLTPVAPPPRTFSPDRSSLLSSCTHPILSFLPLNFPFLSPLLISHTLISVMSSFAPPSFYTQHPRSPCPEAGVCANM